MPAADHAEVLRHLDAAVRILGDRLRRRSAGWWRSPSACAGWSRADVVAHLVASYAAAEQRLTGRGGAAMPPRPPRDDVLADQYAVTARDLLDATTRTGSVHDAGVALGETLVHRWDLEGCVPDEDAAAAVLETVLNGGREGAAAADLLLLLTGRTGELRAWCWGSPGTDTGAGDPHAPGADPEVGS